MTGGPWVSTSKTLDPAQAARDARPARNEGLKRRRRPDRRPWRQAVLRDWQLYTLAILPLAFFAIFRYLPMIGNVIAFRKYRPGGSLFGEEWVGLRYIQLFLGDPTFWNVLLNTVILGLLTLLICFPLPIVLALLINEVRGRAFKRFVQSISYLPHFLSTVVVAGIFIELLSLNGPVNRILRSASLDPIAFMQEPGWFRTVYISSELWQTVGWGTIIYLAALTMVDDQLYEAARIDGAGRLRQIWHVTLPGIRPTIMAVFVLNTGTFMAVGFEKVLLLYNPLTYPTADVINTYLYRLGIVSGNFSYAGAIGLFEAVIGLIMVLSANLLSRRTVGAGLW
ncbi:sugar ABC transporter permease [Streptosporangiaceae bacterium NEAU-GS5]|nr:sugar ABC transporter permease [Streptosporangiaceae bacterium NEAU-GS5]